MATPYDLARLLPHRPPFLLIDRILAVDRAAGELTAARLLSANDALVLAPLPFYIEALCQAAACLNGLSLSAEAPGHRGYLAGISDFALAATDQGAVAIYHRGASRFAIEGDLLILQVRRERSLGALQALHGAVWRRAGGQPDQLLASGRLLLTVVAGAS